MGFEHAILRFEQRDGLEMWDARSNRSHVEVSLALIYVSNTNRHAYVETLIYDE